MSDIELIDHDTFFVQIKNNSTQNLTIIDKIISLHESSYIFRHVANIINSKFDTDYDLTINDSYKCNISTQEEVITKGYIFNSRNMKTKILYELTLIKIDNDYFDDNEEDTASNVSNLSDVSYISGDSELIEELEDFGDFKSNTEVLFPIYSYTDNQYKQDNSDNGIYFTSNDNVVKEQKDIQFRKITQCSQVPSYCTQISSWSPQLMSELSYRLSLPNSGLI